ncbi:hypothetical protein ACSBR1_025030 [Camellia fascicularis]
MEPEQFTVLPKWVQFPTNIAYRLYETKQILACATNNASRVSDLYQYGSVMLGCDVYAIRHYTEFKPQWLTLLQDLQPKLVIPLGLMPLAMVEYGGVNETWLSITLGSKAMPSQEKVTELALGWSSLAPQLKILGHELGEGFLTHYGWSSVIEGLQFGKPLIMLSFMVDQGLNARVLHKKKVGIEIPKDEEDRSFTRNLVADSIRLVMVDNNEGLIYRKKVREMSALFGDKVLHDQ